MVRNFLLNFNTLRRGDAGAYAELYEDLAGAGYGVFYLESRMAVWLIMNALLVMALAMAVKTGNIQGRKEVKEKIKRTMIVALLLLNVAGFVGCSLHVGLDMH